MSILFVGDLLYDYEECQADLSRLGAHFLERGHRVVPNLEGPIQGTEFDRTRGIVLSQGKAAVAALERLQAVAVNLANNHILDWGLDGLARTMRALDDAGIVHFGAGEDLERATRLEVIEEEGRRIGLLGFGSSAEECIPAARGRAGVAPLRTRQVLESIRRSRPQVDFLVVSLHWGYEYELLPLPVDRELARRAVEAGADLVVGHHPHVMQAVETYRQKRIFYSLGNFYFGTRREDFTTLNPIAARHSQVGMGVVLTLAPVPRVEPIFFQYASGQTEVRETGFEVLDLSSISMVDYNAYFEAHRTMRWKPILKSGPLQAPVNVLRAWRFAARGMLARLARALGIHARLKRMAGRPGAPP